MSHLADDSRRRRLSARARKARELNPGRPYVDRFAPIAAPEPEPVDPPYSYLTEIGTAILSRFRELGLTATPIKYTNDETLAAQTLPGIYVCVAPTRIFISAVAKSLRLLPGKCLRAEIEAEKLMDYYNEQPGPRSPEQVGIPAAEHFAEVLRSVAKRR